MFDLIYMVAFGTGSTLAVCSRYLQDELQCCSQSDEEVLGMTLNTAIRHVSLGSELLALQASYGNLITALSSKLHILLLAILILTIKEYN